MELNSVLKRVRALIEKAEHPGTPDAEAAACRERADEIMTKYAIEDIQLQMAKPLAEQAKATQITIDIGAGDSLFLQEMSTLANIVGKYCRVKTIWLAGSGRYSLDHQEKVRVFGYESDLRYFELLFTTIHLHMIGAIFPSPDESKFLEDNCWELHNAGLNWLDIARAYGWVKLDDGDKKYGEWQNRHTGERARTAKVGSYYKRAYYRAAKARNEAPRVIPASGSLNFRKNAARGYLSRIYQRLNSAAGKREASTELVLANRQEGIDALVQEFYPELRETKARKMAFNPEAYTRGMAHANTANLNPAAAASTRQAIP